MSVILDLVCCLSDLLFFGGGAGGALSARGSNSPVSFDNSQTVKHRSQKCQFADCRSLTFRSTDYCWKHQEGKPHESDGPRKPNAGDSVWWEDKED